MNPHPPPPTDEDLAREERELAALYRRLPKPEPDAALDARVLAEADRAVTRSARRRAPPWLVGLGSAAALVLVAGIIWRMQPTLHESTLPPMTPDASMTARKSSTPIESTPRAPAEVPRSAPAPVLQDAAPAQPASTDATSAKQSARVAEPEQGRAAEKSGAGSTPSKPRPQAIDEERARRAAGPRDLPRTRLDSTPLMQPAPPPISAPAAPPAPPPLADSIHPEAADSAATPEKIGTPRSIEALVDAARDALRRGDEEAARNHVRTLLRDYPQFTLPDDLAVLATTPSEGRR